MNQETKFGTEKISKLMLELADISSDRNTDRQSGSLFLQAVLCAE